MSQSFSSPSPMQPLSIGNVVTAGLRIYRSHLKSYFLLALKAYLWILVPVYGWAKFYAICGLLSRLAFGELVNQPESIEAGSRYVNSKLWQFLVTFLLMFLIGVGIFICFVILVAIFAAIFAGLAAVANIPIVIGITVPTILLLVVSALVPIIIMLWLITRFFVVVVPLAIEENVNGSSTINRSWNLTKGYVWRISVIIFVAFLITLPIEIASEVVNRIVETIFSIFLQQDSSELNLLGLLITLCLTLLSGAVVMPFWQAIKAVLYYDIRTRREGLGLKLRDRDI